MTEAINEMIRDWRAVQNELSLTRDPLTIEGQKNIIKAELIERFIEQLKYLRDEV